MDIDTEILKTLGNIEKLLKGAMASTGTGRIPVSSARNKKPDAGEDTKRPNKVFKANASAISKMTDTILGLDKNLKGLNQEVGKTTKSFSSLTSSMARFAASLAPAEQPKNPTGSIVKLPAHDETIGNLDKQLQSIFEQLRASTGRLGVIGSHTSILSKHGIDLQFEANKWLEQIALNTTGMGARAQTPRSSSARKYDSAENTKLITATRASVPLVNELKRLTTLQPSSTGYSDSSARSANTSIPASPGNNSSKEQKDLRIATASSVSIFDKLTGRLDITTRKMELFGTVLQHLRNITEKLVDDFFSLAHIGMGSTDNLISLSKFAFQSGMSLKEYTNIVNANITAASRAGSLDNFNRLISAADGQLAAMGIFGKDAREMQGALAQSNTMMGVSSANLNDAISGQIDIFDKLRKSTNMTSQEFANLVDTLTKNEQVQKELLGLAPNERMARRQEFIQLETTGQRLGLAADASKELADALIRQRGETVKGRFDQAGRVRQISQMLGMGDSGEQAAQIIMKGRSASDNEIETLRQLVGSLDTASQVAYQNGSLGMQSNLDFFNETLGGTNIGSIMKANRSAELAQDSGKVNQEAFGKHVGEFGQFTGQLLKYMVGFNESAGPGILGAVSAGILLLFGKPLAATLSSVVSKITSSSIKASSATQSSSLGTKAGNIWNGLKTIDILGPLKSLPNSILSTTNSIKTGALAIGESAKIVPETFGNISNGISKFFKNFRFNFAMISNAEGPGMAVVRTFQGIGDGLSVGAKSLGSGVAKVSRVLGDFPLIGGLISAAFEAITGEVANALNPNAGIFERLGGIATSFFSALPNFIFDILGAVFGPKLTENLQNGFDQFVAVANGAIKYLFGMVFDGWSKILSWILPEDSPLVKKLNEWGVNSKKSASENFDTAKSLAEDHSKTLSTISKDNVSKAELAKKSADDTEKATAQVKVAQSKFDNVQYGMEITRSGLLADASAIIAQPQLQTPRTVKADSLNTQSTSESASSTGGAVQYQKTNTGISSPEIVAALNTLIGLMRQSVSAEEQQVILQEQMLKNNRPAASFISAETMAQRLLKQG